MHIKKSTSESLKCSFFNAFSDFPLMRKMYFQGQPLDYMLETEGFDIAMITLTILSKSSTVSSPFAS